MPTPEGPRPRRRARGPWLRRVAMVIALVLVAAAVAVGVATWRGAGEDEAAPAPAPSEDVETLDSDAPAPPPPERGCYDLAADEAAEVTTEGGGVPCDEDHTSQTYLVGRIPPDVAGLAPTLDVAAISRAVDRRCESAFAAHVGGDDEDRALARLDHRWFVPTEDDLGRGSRWFRCDVVADQGGDEGGLALLPPVTAGILDEPDGLDTYGTCAVDADGLPPESEWQICALDHDWRAIAAVRLGEADDPFPGEDAFDEASAACEPAARDYLDDAVGELTVQWVRPNRVQWTEGRRFGLCWTPAE